jgi:hypothetical protein
LETEWTKRSVLPQLRTSPPPSSAQKVHGVAAESKNTTLPPPPAIPARTATPAGQASSIQHVLDPDIDITTPDSDPEEDEPAAQTDRDPQREQQQQQPPPQPQPLVTTPAMATLQTAHAAQSQNPYQHFQQPYVQQPQQKMVNQQRSTTLGPDRSIITAAGGITAIGGPSQVEKLPADTGKFCYIDTFLGYSGALFPCSFLYLDV